MLYKADRFLEKIHPRGFAEVIAKVNGINFSYAVLNGAKLSETNFTGADLIGAYMYGADLNDAVLVKANLVKFNQNSEIPLHERYV